MRRSQLILPTVLIATLVSVAGCASTDTDGATSSATSMTSTAAPVSESPSNAGSASRPTAAVSEPGISDEPPFPADAAEDTEAPSGDAMLVLEDVRFGEHSGFDRVVLEFSGPGTPGWTVQYAASASRQGMGGPITVIGGGILDVIVTGTTYPSDGVGGFPSGSQPAAGTSVTEIYSDGTFEGQTHVVIGTASEQPFRVFSVQDPPRVVIDVRH